MASKPLLSICIPTFHRSGFLRVTLEALLPQAAQLGSKVEVWVSDNGSPDDTREVVDAAARLGPVKYSRNDSNLGSLANIVISATQLATGEYVWIVGDHNLFASGALASVVHKLEAHKHLDLLYVNFKAASYPADWPSSSIGGYDGRYSYLANERTVDREVEHWSELIQPGTSALCTQAYAHVVRTALWRNFWSDRDISVGYTSGATTYPHAWMIAETHFAQPAFYIGEPALTIFNGAQSWGDRVTRARVSLRGLPELIGLYEQQGLPVEKLIAARRFACRLAYEATLGLLEEDEGAGKKYLSDVLGAGGAFRHPYLLGCIWRAYIDSEASPIARILGRLKRMLHA
jgi:glycosyltransferase involved in cell wall biosynthesis